MPEECQRLPLWSQENDGTHLSNSSSVAPHDDAEIMSWLLPCPPLTPHHCFGVPGNGGCAKSHPFLVANNARENVASLDRDGAVMLNMDCVEAAAHDDGMKTKNMKKKKKKKKKRVSGEAGINRGGRMMMMVNNRDRLMVNRKDLLPPMDSGSDPTKQPLKQQAPNRDIIAALLPHGGGDEPSMIVESTSSALSGRGSSSCMEVGGSFNSHGIIHANGQSLSHSLIKVDNLKVADNLDCVAQFNSVSDLSRGSSSTTKKSVKEIDESLERKISNADESDGQSEASKDLSAQLNVEEEGVDMEQKKPSSRLASAKRTRAAEVHNESERRRRDRINEKMRALQQIIPNSNKTDKTSMLDEAIEYLKYLQAKVQYLSMNLGPLMMPMGIQLQQNLSLGMGIMDVGLGASNPMPHPQLHYLPGCLPNPPLPSAIEGLEYLQPPTNGSGNGNAMNSHSSSTFIPHPHRLQWMQQVVTHARPPPSVQVNMHQQLQLPSLQQAKTQMNQSLGKSTR